MKKILVLVLLVGHIVPVVGQTSKIRNPAVAGMFYPNTPEKLKTQLKSFFDQAEPKGEQHNIIGLMVPHAGYAYSGQIAADGYNQVSANSYDVIVILAPSHRDPFSGVTIYPGKAYKTPLSTAKIDKELAGALVKSDFVRFSEQGHQAEHAIEVQIPFIQYLFPHASILPMVVGGYDNKMCKNVGETLARHLKGKNALIVASTDLYHGYSYDTCKSVDTKTLTAITSVQPKELCQGLSENKYQACGGAPVVIMQYAARSLGYNHAKIVSRTNSGDVTHKRDGYIVGYGSVIIYQKSTKIEYDPLGRDAQLELLKFARQAIVDYLKNTTIPKFESNRKELYEKRGVFVTLTKNDQLAGCIGIHESNKPLIETVPNRAVAAAFYDPRFPAVTENDLDEIKIEISVYLTNVYPIKHIKEFRMGEHGIIMEKDGKAATFLPKVPLQAGWTRVEEEMQYLCLKAGLSLDSWKDPTTKFWVYKTQVFAESL